MELPHLTNTNFPAHIKAHPLLIVDYFADWCGPCQMMAPIFQEVADQISATRPEIAFAKINIDEARTAADAAGVMSIPTFVVYKDGEEIDRHIGGLSATELTHLVEENFPA